MLSHELGELAVETGIFPLYEVEDGVVRHYGKTKADRGGPAAQAGARVPAQAGPLRPLHRGRPRLLPGQGRRDVGQVGDPGRDPVLEGAAPATSGVRRAPAATALGDTPTTRRGHDPSRSTPRGAGPGHPGRRIPSARPPAQAWEPSKPIEFVIPAGTGRRRRPDGASDRGHRREAPALAAAVHRGQQVGRARARRASSTSRARRVTPTPSSSRCPTSSRRRSTPGCPSAGRISRPIARMALDEFILWVNAETPYKTAKEYVAAAKERSGGDRMKMGGDRLGPGRPDPHDPARAGAPG